MALMDKDDMKRGVFLIGAVSVVLAVTLLVLIETGIIFAQPG